MRTQYIILEVVMNELEQGKENVGNDVKRIVESELQYVSRVRVVDEVTVRCSPLRPCILREQGQT